MNKDICYGIVLFFIVKSILGITELIGFEIVIALVHNVYKAPILLAVVSFALLMTCFRMKKFPDIKLWVIPLILFTNLLSAYLDYSKELVEIYSEVDRAILFTSMTGVQEISLVVFVIIAYIKYYRLK